MIEYKTSGLPRWPTGWKVCRRYGRDGAMNAGPQVAIRCRPRHTSPCVETQGTLRRGQKQNGPEQAPTPRRCSMANGAKGHHGMHGHWQSAWQPARARHAYALRKLKEKKGTSAGTRTAGYTVCEGAVPRRSVEAAVEQYTSPPDAPAPTHCAKRESDATGTERTEQRRKCRGWDARQRLHAGEGPVRGGSAAGDTGYM